ncbi:MAG TPA: DinB family protein [Bryobacteraceae bacterium]|jgi:uncharacterized damage-inducible protein DinB
MKPTTRIDGFRGEFLWELEIAERQLIRMADAVPAAKYDWRPDEKTRSVSEILVHVAAGNFMLLNVVGIPVPSDLYIDLPASGLDRFLAIIRVNDALEKSVHDKDAVLALLKRSLLAVAESVSQPGCEAELDRRVRFFGELSTVRRVYLRLLVHLHEHMGQMIAYLRVNGIAPPWPDWRPDRRA